MSDERLILARGELEAAYEMAQRLIEDNRRLRAALAASEAAREALVAALQAARMPHQRVEGDPWFTCPVAWREDHEGWDDTCFRCDGKPCTHGCECGAEEHNAAIDRAVAAQPAAPAPGEET